MQLISKFDKGIRFLLCAIDIFSKYEWIIPLNKKKVPTITNAFRKMLDESNRKPNKLWEDNGSQFYNRSMKSWIKETTHKCIQHIMKENLLLLKNLLEPFENLLEQNYDFKIRNYMTLKSENVCKDDLDELINTTKHIIEQLK